MTVSQWRVLHMSKLGKVRDKIDAQEPLVDRWLIWLASYERTAWIVIAAAVVALFAGVVLWLL